MLPHFGDIRDQIWSGTKFAKMLHVFGPYFFWGGGKFLKLIYKIQPVSDHVAKFQDDRSSDPEERVAKKRKTSAVKHSRCGTS